MLGRKGKSISGLLSNKGGVKIHLLAIWRHIPTFAPLL